jgi:hypothetical protein
MLRNGRPGEEPTQHALEELIGGEVLGHLALKELRLDTRAIKYDEARRVVAAPLVTRS